jgi:hypothetical protein
MASVVPAFQPPLNRPPLFAKVTLLAFLLTAIPLPADLLLQIAPAGTNSLLTRSNPAAT